MRKAEIIMGMPIEIEIADSRVAENDFKEIFDWFREVDERFSTYKKNSEISKINRGEISEKDFSKQMRMIFDESARTKIETAGFFDIRKKDGSFDPSGIVKGWAIYEAGKKLVGNGFVNFFVEAGGDIEVRGLSSSGEKWTVGIRHPFEKNKISKVLALDQGGIATSGIYERGAHIYNPLDFKPVEEIVSLTVVGPNIYDADRLATAAFAMGRNGIYFIEKLPGFEAYMIDKEGIATFTSGFDQYFAK